MKPSALVLTFAMLSTVALAGRSRAVQYSIVDLGLLPGGDTAQALNVNNRGQVVGVGSTATGETHAILWDNGQAIDLGTLGGASSRAWGINDRGQIVGESDTATGEGHAFLWQNGEMLDLAETGDFNRAFAINQRAEVVGHFQFEGLLWRRGTLIELGILSAVDINDRGVIAGSDNASGEFRAVLWNRGDVIDLGTLPGDTRSFARSINKHGQVVGESSGGPTGIHAFLWDNGEMVELRGLLPPLSTFVTDINNRGQSVGQSASLGGDRAVLWNDRTGEPIDLGTLPGDPFSFATAINDHGLIVGYSGSSTGRAVAWIPQR